MSLFFNSSKEAFKFVNSLALQSPDNVFESRIGNCNEIMNLNVTIMEPEDEMDIPEANRIPYDYASSFWDFMISGGTDAAEHFKNFPNVKNFVNKPKSPDLPDNFNTLYGPRIVNQLEPLIKELKKSNTRRGTVCILDAADQVLLDKDETIEYPCTVSVTFSPRNGKLHSHVHMRSQNLAVVWKLDLYLQTRLLKHIAELTGYVPGTLSFSMVSAHIFERDFDYIRSFTQ